MEKRMIRALGIVVMMLVMTGSAVMAAPGDGSGKKKTYPADLSQIVGIVVEEHEAEWYHQQYEGWRKQTLQDPKDELAWMNCYRAKGYEIMYTPDYPSADSVKSVLLEEMKRCIPGTYTYYACSYMGPGMGQQESYDAGWNAFRLMPKKKTFYDYDTWLCFLKLVGDKQHYPAFAKEYVKSGIYSKELITFSMNELDCMEEGGIYVGNGDVTVIPKWLIQDGLGKHRDKLVLTYSFFFNDGYCQQLYDELGIGEVPPMPELEYYEDYDIYIQKVINEVAVRTGRKLYMSKFNASNCYLTWDKQDALYDIGLLYVCSPDAPVDIIEEQKRLLEKCDLRYLGKPIRKDAWIADTRMSSAMTQCFWQLMLEYKGNGDTANYNKVHGMMEKAVNRISDEKWKDFGKSSLEEYVDR